MKHWRSILTLSLAACSASKYENYSELHTLPEKFDEMSVDRYLLTQYKDVDTEHIKVLYLKDNTFIKESIFMGSRYRASVPVLQIIEQCAFLNCNKVIFVHNHVATYFAHPSETDFNTTKLLKERFIILNITLIAHVVVADHDTYWIR